jgi:hypothetical protein
MIMTTTTTTRTVYFVDCWTFGVWFDTYEDAELFCGENGIHPENIYEEQE